MTTNIRVGVVGVGYLGKFHAKIYANMEGVDLVGVADNDPQTAKKIAAEYGCQAYTNSTDLLGKVDAVSIVVPTVYHLDIARPFLDSGVHMLMEKPIAPSYEESLQLVELAEKAKVVFQVGHLERFNAGVMALAERVKNPRFIEAHRLSPFVARATDVDVVTDLMIHDIDIILSLVKSEIDQISAAGTPVITDHIDIANVRLGFKNGAVANVTASRVSTKRYRRIRIFEQQHYYSLNYEEQQLEIAAASPTKDENGWPEITHETLHLEPCLPLDSELAAFIHSVRTNTPPLVTGRVGLEAVRVANIIKENMSACL
ncbi:Gfo/Idh/MocA family oxidoreductase [Kaarinaea lacus]